MIVTLIAIILVVVVVVVRQMFLFLLIKPLVEIKRGDKKFSIEGYDFTFGGLVLLMVCFFG